MSYQNYFRTRNQYELTKSFYASTSRLSKKYSTRDRIEVDVTLLLISIANKINRRTVQM